VCTHLSLDRNFEKTAWHAGIVCDSVSAGVDSGEIDDGIGIAFGTLRGHAPAKKGQSILERICARFKASMRHLTDTRAEQIAFTRFFRNPRVTAKEIVATAAARTAEAARGRHVVLIQDTSEINYQAKAQRKRGLGRVGNGSDVGLFVHPAIAVDAADGSVLGLAAATIWRRIKAKQKDYQSKPIESKESFKWLGTAQAGRDALATAARITHVGDRECDIYEVFARLPDERSDVVIRATKDRAVIGPDKRPGRLFATVAAQPEAGRIAFELTARPGRTARTVTLSVRCCQVTLRQPRRGAAKRDPRQITLDIVEAREIDPPAGEAAIHWQLLTTHRVTSLTQAAFVVDLYRLRWTIEQVFRTLKSQGLDLEESLIADGFALEALAATALIAATKVMQLVHGRGEAGRHLPAARLFDATEMAVLDGLTRQLEGKTVKQQNPHPHGSLAWSVWAIARLGGWKGYASERPPGPITIVHGLQRFEAIVQGVRLAPYLRPPDG